MKKLAIIGAQRMARNYAINAREMGVETHCFAWEKGAVAKDYVDKFHPISIFDIEAIFDILKEVKVDGVVSTSELTISIAAELATRLQLPSLRLDVARVITDKYRNRCATRNVYGLNHPRFALIKDLDDARKSDIGFPCIMKPLSEGGKRGVIVIQSAKELEDAFIYTANESKRKDAYLLEEFLANGREYSVESLSCHGKNSVVQITEKITSGPPHCVELGHFQPANLSRDLETHVIDVIDRSLTAIGMTEGPCHTEIKIINGEIYLIEFNARPGGDFISYPLIDLSTGYSYLKEAIKIAINESTMPIHRPLNRSYSGVCFVTNQTPMLIPIFESCELNDWCWKKHAVGDFVDLTHNDCDNSNYFIWTAADGVPDQLRHILNAKV